MPNKDELLDLYLKALENGASLENILERLPPEASDPVHAGQRLRTHAASSATLVFFDGSRTTLGPNTDLSMDKVEGGWGKVIQVALNQTAGKTTHSVVPFR